jgi:hypothetical protein
MNHAGRYASIGRPGLMASHQSWLGQSAASVANGTDRYEPAGSFRHRRSAVGEVKASTWVRFPVVHVPQPSGSRPAIASADTGSSRSDCARMRK